MSVEIRRSPRKHAGSSPGKGDIAETPASSVAGVPSPVKPKTLGQHKADLVKAKRKGKPKVKTASQRKLDFARGTSPSPPRKAKKAKGGGRKAGRANWTDERVKILLDIVAIFKPAGAAEWERVANEWLRRTKEFRDATALRRHFRKLARTKPKTGQSTVPPLIDRARTISDSIIQKTLSKELDDVIDEGETLDSGDETEDYNASDNDRDSPETSSSTPPSTPPSPEIISMGAKGRARAAEVAAAAGAGSGAGDAEAGSSSTPHSAEADTTSGKKRKRKELMPTASFNLAADSPAAKGRRRVDSSLNKLAKTVSSSLESASRDNGVSSMLPMMAMLNQMQTQQMMAMAAMFGRGPFGSSHTTPTTPPAAAAAGPAANASTPVAN